MNTKIILQTQALSKHFGDLIAVDKLSLDVYQGEILGFLGPNGAGKSTSIKMICRLLKPTSGTLLIEGKPMNKNERAFRKVGLCPQENIFWPKLTCIEQLVFMAEMYGIKRPAAATRSMKMLADMGLFDKKDSLAQNLSGGMKRRLNICLALIHDPEILVLDEPEAGLDPQSRVLVREFIRSMAIRKTIILTTHNMDEAERLADRIAIMDHGKILVTDTPDALKRLAGDHDRLSIQLLVQDDTLVQPVIPALEELAGKVVYSNSALTLQGQGIIEKTSDVINLLKLFNLPYGEIHFRKATLEDIFIQLTGRKLRE